MSNITDVLKLKKPHQCSIKFSFCVLLFIASSTCSYAEGDITAVRAGSGLSGGGETGDVTLNVNVPLGLLGNQLVIIRGTNTSIVGKGIGVSGISNADKGIGVSGKNTKTNNFGYVGTSNAGVYGFSNNNPGIVGISKKDVGVSGNSTDGVGVRGSSQHNVAIEGRNTTNNNVGVLGSIESGVSGSSINVGIIGTNSNTSTAGKLGGSNFGVEGDGGINQDGVHGISIERIGVFGRSNNGIGVIGTSISGYAGYFSGRVGIGTWDGGENLPRIRDASVRLFVSGKVEIDGSTKVKVLQITGGSDLSEKFEVTKTKGLLPKPGMVVSIDPDNPGKLTISKNAYDRRVAGIVSGAGNVNHGIVMGQPGSLADGEYPVALTGRVYCLADAVNGQIQPGDLLTASGIPGHAMKVTDHKQAPGAVIGKAMTGLESGKGLVLVLVSLQ